MLIPIACQAARHNPSFPRKLSPRASCRSRTRRATAAASWAVDPVSKPFSSALEVQPLPGKERERGAAPPSGKGREQGWESFPRELPSRKKEGL